MTMADIDHAINATLGVEGKWSDHPSDPGGKTMYGVTEATLARAHRLGVVGHEDIRSLSVSDARRIYKALYWQPIRGDELPRGLNALVFDIQVNSGQGGRRLQAALNTLGRSGLVTDNAIGPRTLAAVHQYLARDPECLFRLMAEVSARRLLHWTSLRIWRTFRVGWSRRGARILIHATRMADGTL